MEVYTSIARRVKGRQLVQDKDIPERLAEIEARGREIKERRLDTHWIPAQDISLVWWTYLEAHHLLPFGGTLADQPEWVILDFAGFNEIAEHEELVYEMDRLKERQGQARG
jgi:hypothetical protein